MPMSVRGRLCHRCLAEDLSSSRAYIGFLCCLHAFPVPYRHAVITALLLLCSSNYSPTTIPLLPHLNSNAVLDRLLSVARP